MLKLILILMGSVVLAYGTSLLALWIVARIPKKGVSGNSKKKSLKQAIEDDDTLEMSLPNAIHEEEIVYLNTGRMKLRKISLGHKVLEPEEVLLPESEDTGEDTIEMVLPREIIPDERPSGIRMVCYAKRPTRPFGWLLRVDNAGRGWVRRFDGVFVRRMRHNLVVLA